MWQGMPRVRERKQIIWRVKRYYYKSAPTQRLAQRLNQLDLSRVASRTDRADDHHFSPFRLLRSNLDLFGQWVNPNRQFSYSGMLST